MYEYDSANGYVHCASCTDNAMIDVVIFVVAMLEVAVIVTTAADT
jgi:hypothetical protein